MTHTVPIVAVVGPTAAGKSELALDLALALGGEVVNADSMQLYRGMDIGTAKLPPEERRGVPHHLLDVLGRHRAGDGRRVPGLAARGDRRLPARGVVPVLVGGSGALRARGPRRVRVPRHRSRRPRPAGGRAGRVGAGGAARAAGRRSTRRRPRRSCPTNGRRIVRALEVIELTGGPFAATLPAARYAYDDVVQIGLDCRATCSTSGSRERVERMWAAGFVDEVRRAGRAGLREGRTASRALGYRQVLACSAGDGCDEDAAQGRDSRGHPPVRPPPAVLVPPRPADRRWLRRTTVRDRARSRAATPYDRHG